ncbi:uncharacterized protein PV06_03354 [Exophiala oligosperma]|uniref:SLS1 C-terminal domain-containing protein n=1 Tax=Exophiala oligosperma TaxID=215243 RepID=A0A0D2DQ14_9EURO|nr:uncharacterized protein PV06_03354 [Exophiala oligosperma]KIW44918.1 hypothetical protein PV06_03354 [Exophiala oligosperma]
MLKRLGASAHVCLRCQRKQIEDSLLPANTTRAPIIFPTRRWQGNAATAPALVEQDDDNDGRERESSSPPHKNASRTKPTSQPRAHYQKSIRHWKPTRTAELGVNSLGKPAEILILPSTDRKIPQVPKDDGDNKTVKAMMRQAIDFEKEPLQLQELKTNIEQVMRLLGKQRGQLEHREWSTLKTHLMKGFTKDHLKHYVMSHADRFKDGIAYIRVLEKGKLPLTKFIVEEIWGFTIPIAVFADSDHSKKNVKAEFRARDEIMDYLLNDEGQQLKKISETHQVQIDVFRSQQRLRVHGTAARVNLASSMIARLLRSFTVISIPFTKKSLTETYANLALQPLVKPFLRSIEQKFHVRIILFPSCINIVHRDRPKAADHAHRELRLAAEKFSEEGQRVFLHPESSLNETTWVPYPTPAELPWGLHQLPWARLMISNKSAQPQKVDHPQAEGEAAVVSEIEKSLHKSTTIPTSRESLHYDLAVKFGTALCRDPTNASSIADPNEESKTMSSQKGNVSSEKLLQANQGKEKHDKLSAYGESCFVEDVPYLAQQLAPMKFWEPTQKHETRGIGRDGLLTLRLVLVPITKTKQYPKLEVVIVAGKSREGKTTLSLSNLSAIFSEKSFKVLCPSQEADMEVVGRSKRDIWYQGKQDPIHFDKLLRDLRSYITRAQNPNRADWVFGPFVNLGFPKHSPDSLLVSQQGIAGKTPRQPTETETTVSKQESPFEKIVYMLQSVEAVDVDSKSISVSEQGSDRKNELCLEHVTFTGSTATKQELRLARQSYFSPPSLEHLDVRLLAQAGLVLVERLGHDPLKKTSLQLGDDVVLQAIPPDATTSASPAGEKTQENGSLSHSAKASVHGSMTKKTKAPKSKPGKDVVRSNKKKGATRPTSRTAKQAKERSVVSMDESVEGSDEVRTKASQKTNKARKSTKT